MNCGDLIQSKNIPTNIGLILDSSTLPKCLKGKHWICVLINGKVKWSKKIRFEVINEH